MPRATLAQLTLIKQGLLKRQGFQCAICEIAIDMKTACVDHDHRTGIIRDALCRNCNGLEGKAYNIANRGKRTNLPKWWMGKLILYWIRHEQDKTGWTYPAHKTDDEKKERIRKLAKAKRVAAKTVKKAKP